jgi:hypothetical protein
MSQKTRTELKGYFETGDIPTEAQFIDLIDSLPDILDDGVRLGGEGAITAYGGGGQANAVLLTKLVNGISVCAAPFDSVKLPVGVAGMVVKVYNSTGNSAHVYPNTDEQIMTLGVNNPQSVSSGDVWEFAYDGVVWAAGQLT